MAVGFQELDLEAVSSRQQQWLKIRTDEMLTEEEMRDRRGNEEQLTPITNATCQSWRAESLFPK